MTKTRKKISFQYHFVKVSVRMYLLLWRLQASESQLERERVESARPEMVWPQSL